VPGKDDPLEQARPRGKVTLWLDRERMKEACDNYWQAYKEVTGLSDDSRPTWDISYAAAVAAFDFLMAGKITP
jgi:hypothetical protein